MCVFNWLLVMVSHFSVILVVFCLCIDVNPLMFLPPPKKPSKKSCDSRFCPTCLFCKGWCEPLETYACWSGEMWLHFWLQRQSYLDSFDHLSCWERDNPPRHPVETEDVRPRSLPECKNSNWMGLVMLGAFQCSMVGSLVDFHMCSVSCSGRNTDWWVEAASDTCLFKMCFTVHGENTLLKSKGTRHVLFFLQPLIILSKSKTNSPYRIFETKPPFKLHSNRHWNELPLN